MKGKVVPLKPRFSPSVNSNMENPWSLIFEFVQPCLGEADICLRKAINKAPTLIKNDLLKLAVGTDWLCAALFLAVALSRGERHGSDKLPGLASSLESLQLALATHSSMKTAETDTDFLHNDSRLSPTKAILAGDFYFSLALTLASDAPVFIKGMAEIISRSVSSEISCSENSRCFKEMRTASLKRISDGRASIVALSATLGAWHGKFEPWENEAFAYYGHYTGMGIHLKREQQLYQANMIRKETAAELTLPLIYVVEQSPRREELISVILNRKKVRDDEFALLIREDKRVDPKSYMDRVTGNCFSKARKYLELLQGSIKRETIELLTNFMYLP